MKKWIILSLIFVMTFVLTGCPGTDPIDNPDEGPKSIEITGYNTTMKIDDELQLTAIVKPAGVSQEVTWSSKNSSVITVDQTGKIKAIALGTTDIVATSKANTRIFKQVTIKVESESVVVEPVSVTITGKNEVKVLSAITLVATVLPAEASQEVLWTSSNDEIATVSSTGRVNGKAEGQVVITATVASNSNLKHTFEVNVVPDVIIIDIPDPTGIIIDGEDQMFKDTSITLIATVLPSGSNQNVVWTTSNATLATVNQSGLVTAIKEGTVYITATSQVDENVTVFKKIVIKIPDPIEPYPNLEGFEIKLMAASHALYEHDPFDDQYKSQDKNAKQRAWLETEANFNCKIKVVGYPDIAPWGPQRRDWIISQAAINDAQADIYVSTTEWMKELVNGNAVVNTKDFYTAYGKNSMMPALKAATTFKGGLYALPTSADSGSLNVENGIFYNIAMIERLGLESPAKLFNEGRWTYTDFYNYVATANSLLSEGQFVLSGEPSLYWHGMVNAGGVRILDTATQSVNVTSTYSRQAVQTLKKIVDLNAWDKNTAWDADVVSFKNGTAIFQAAELWFVRTDNRWPSTLWDENGNSRFGYVPFPYPDSLQKENTRTVYPGGACYMLANGRVYPASVTSRHVYRAFTEMMLLTTKYVKSDATYSLEGLMTLAAQSKVDDPESVKAIVFFKNDKVIFDPVDIIEPFWTTGSIGIQIRNAVIQGTDFDEAVDGAVMRLSAKLLEIYG